MSNLTPAPVNMSPGLTNNSKMSEIADIPILKDRAEMLSLSRQFFAKRKVMEVDCPLITSQASVDPYIDLMSVHCQQEVRFLHSSPEYAMKRLLAGGIGDIYQLGHVFRDDEYGRLHNPEFTMAEWYRLGFTFEQMIEDTLEYIFLFLGRQPFTQLSYREAFLRFTGLDYLKAAPDTLIACLKSHGVAPYTGLEQEGKDAILNVLLSVVVEPALKQMGLCVLRDYPASQAALAQVVSKDDELVAERFEVFYEGVELANGYHELADAEEQRKRFQEANKKRLAEGRSPLPIDEAFLKALEKGIPDCCGVAVGFDRLMLLRHRAAALKDVLPLCWRNS